MHYFKIIVFVIVCSCTYAYSQTNESGYELIKINEVSELGFHYPYLLYIPYSTSSDSQVNKESTLLVVPNNSGVSNDTLLFHENIARKQILIWAKIANKLNSPILMPIFPRSRMDSYIYTHALDRDVLTTSNEKFERLDLQLISMIENSDNVLKERNIHIDKKVWMTGYSASGMFTNRFTFIHPEIIKSAAIGSPGGWPIAPLSKYNSKPLRYPIGISDLNELVKKQININELKTTPLFIYMGDEDNNDSVIYSDGYDGVDKDLIFELFGKTPLERWSISNEIYNATGINSKFKLYKGVGHTINNDMINDIVMFFKSNY